MPSRLGVVALILLLLLLAGGCGEPEQAAAPLPVTDSIALPSSTAPPRSETPVSPVANAATAAVVATTPAATVVATPTRTLSPLTATPAQESTTPASGASPPTGISFEKSAQTFASVPTWKIGLGDLDGDGDLDAVFANGQANHSQVWLSDGGGTFVDSGQQLLKYGHGIDIGDLDGDGDLDVFLTTHQASTPSKVYLNDGHGMFEDSGQDYLDVGYHLVLADVDLDGDLDALAEDTSATKIYTNDGTGHFTLSETNLPPAAYAGDLDSDGDVDLLFKEEGVGYSAMLNDGAGNFSPHWAYEDNTAMLMGDAGLGDVDGDGDLDAVISNGHFQSTSHPALVFLNDGTGRFTDSGQRLSAVSNAAVSLGDLDGDGDLDLVLTDYEEPGQIWLNDGTGQFSDSGFRFGGSEFYRHAHLGDLDSDGDLDLFLATFGIDRGPNEIWFNTTPAVAFSLEISPQKFNAPGTFQAGLGDLDGDGDLDAVFANPQQHSSEVWLNDGSGTLVDSGQQLTQYGHGVGVADFDADGDLDAFIACHNFVAPSRIYLNDGRGTMRDTGQDLGDTGISGADLHLVDINGDGHMDVHVMYYDPKGLPDKVYLNDGRGTFTDSGLALDEEVIAWGDLDADGDVDLFGKRWGEGYVVRLNDGAGMFSEGWTMADSRSMDGGVALADFDGDGDLDALVANGFRTGGSHPTLLLWNDGIAQFTDSGQQLNPTMLAEMGVGDLDGDGDLDVFVANADLPNEVWLNDGDGGFFDTGLRLGKATDLSAKPSLGDLDGDGDLDVLVGSFVNGLEVWLNTTTASRGTGSGEPDLHWGQKPPSLDMELRDSALGQVSAPQIQSLPTMPSASPPVPSVLQRAIARR